MAIPIPVDLELGSSPAGGLLASARTLPAGWQHGVSFTDTACLAPVVMGECPSGTNLKPGQRADAAEFRPVSVIQAVECTVTAGVVSNLDGLSGTALQQTADFALARELLTGEASTRDRNPNVPGWTGNPGLVNTAVDLGDFTLVNALACLDQNLHATTSGRGGFIFVGVDMATHLKDQGLIWRDGARWLTAAGTVVIISAGFDGRAPVADGAGTPPVAATPLTLYASAGVWAATGQTDVYSDVNRSVNTATSRSEQVGLVAFSPCAVFAATATDVTSCG